MEKPKLTLIILHEQFAICRLEANAPVPDWALSTETFTSITRTQDELSIVCTEANVPNEIKSEKGWRALKVEGPLDFSVTGILASLAKPLAEAQVSIFTVSTFDTDYILVKEDKLDKAVKILSHFCDIKH